MNEVDVTKEAMMRLAKTTDALAHTIGNRRHASWPMIRDNNAFLAKHGGEDVRKIFTKDEATE